MPISAVIVWQYYAAAISSVLDEFVEAARSLDVSV